MKQLILLIALGCASLPALAEVSVKDPWVRATVPEQQASGAFMALVSTSKARLVEAHSNVANVVEIHEMAMEKDVMKMRAIPGLDLPAGKAVELKPGSYHVMLMGLKQQLKEGSSVPLTLVVEEGGKRKTIDVTATVRALNFQPAAGQKR